MLPRKSTIYYWIYPSLWGIMMYNVLRAITDLAKKDSFWYGDIRTHLIPLFFSVLICYLFDFNWKHRLKRRPNVDVKSDIVREYLLVLAEIIIPFNSMLLIGEWAGVFYMGAGGIDYMLINIAYVPLLFLFYMVIRNNIANISFQEKVLLLEQLKTEKYETELKFLKSQYHPHFLFNALNTVYFQIEETNDKARESIEQLSDLLRYQLYDIHKKVTIAQEIRYISSYIAFQQLRKSEKLVLQISIDPELNHQQVHPLLFQPLIENAFKYVGEPPYISLIIRLDEGRIYFEVRNSVSLTTNVNTQGGIGIENLKLRLDLLYKERYILNTYESGGFFTAELTLILD